MTTYQTRILFKAIRTNRKVTEKRIMPLFENRITMKTVIMKMRAMARINQSPKE